MNTIKFNVKSVIDEIERVKQNNPCVTSFDMKLAMCSKTFDALPIEAINMIGLDVKLFKEIPYGNVKIYVDSEMLK